MPNKSDSIYFFRIKLAWKEPCTMCPWLRNKSPARICRSYIALGVIEKGIPGRDLYLLPCTGCPWARNPRQGPVCLTLHWVSLSREPPAGTCLTLHWVSLSREPPAGTCMSYLALGVLEQGTPGRDLFVLPCTGCPWAGNPQQGPVLPCTGCPWAGNPRQGSTSCPWPKRSPPPPLPPSNHTLQLQCQWLKFHVIRIRKYRN